MAKAISESINRRIIEEYAPGKISKAKLAIALGVSQSHVNRVLKSDRTSVPSQKNSDRASVSN